MRGRTDGKEDAQSAEVYCCRFAQIQEAAEQTFGRSRTWRQLALRAMSHGPDSAVFMHFLDQWERLFGRCTRVSTPQACGQCLKELPHSDLAP